MVSPSLLDTWAAREPDDPMPSGCSEVFSHRKPRSVIFYRGQ